MPRAAVLTRFQAPLELREFKLPHSLPPRAALVRTEMAGICGTDVHLWKGELPISLDEFRDAPARVEAVRELTGGHGADAVIECVGSPGAVAEGMNLCRDGGKYLILGHYCDAGPVELNPHLITRKQLRLFGSWSSEPRHLKMALEFLRRRQREFPFASMVSHRFPLEQANQALSTTADWAAHKSVIMPGGR